MLPHLQLRVVQAEALLVSVYVGRTKVKEELKMHGEFRQKFFDVVRGWIQKSVL